MEERKLFLRVRSHMMTDSVEFLNNWDQRKAWINFSQKKQYVEALQLVLFMAVNNPGLDLNILFKTDIRELGDASGHVGLLYSKDGSTMLARTMYDPDGFGDPGEDFRGQTELYKNGQIVKKVYFGWAINGNDNIPYFQPDSIKTLQDAEAFFKWCGDNIGGGFHPDTPFEDYTTNDGEELFNPVEADRYDRLMDEVRDVFDTEEEMYECLESVTGLMAYVNGLDEKKYPIGTRFMNNTNGKIVEVTETVGIDDYGIQVVGKPKDIKNFSWSSEGEIDTMLKRGAYSTMGPADDNDDLDDSVASRYSAHNKDNIEERQELVGEQAFIYNGWNINIFDDVVRDNTKRRKYYSFEAFRDGEFVDGNVTAELDIPSLEWSIDEITFDDPEGEETLTKGSSIDEAYEQFSEGINFYKY